MLARTLSAPPSKLAKPKLFIVQANRKTQDA
jgi:hypothetical protein